jgi:hypothetical protein
VGLAHSFRAQHRADRLEHLRAVAPRRNTGVHATFAGSALQRVRWEAGFARRFSKRCVSIPRRSPSQPAPSWRCR